LVSASSLYSGSAKLSAIRIDGTYIPLRFRALETSNAEDHRMRFFGFNSFNSFGLEQKLITEFVLAIKLLSDDVIS
jgi:hypothetical protein